MQFFSYSDLLIGIENVKATQQQDFKKEIQEIKVKIFYL